MQHARLLIHCLGRETASYCPSTVNATGSCPPGEYTEFAGGDGSLAMGVVVPGGQLVYIDAECGAVGYTQAHSAALPKGAIVDGWNKTEGPSFGYLTHENGLIACPATDSETGKPNGWQVFVQLPGLFFIETCLGFSALTSNTTQPGAWQYT